jgi:hypothetical protein
MPNTLLVSIPRSDYLSHACSQQAHNDSSHAAIFLLSIVKHPSWSIHRVRVQSGDVWCGGKKHFLSLGVQSFRQPQDPPNRTEADLLLSHQIWWFSTPKIGWLKIHDLPRSSPSKKIWSLPSATHVGAHVTVATFPVHYCGMGGSSWTCQGDMPNCLWV